MTGGLPVPGADTGEKQETPFRTPRVDAGATNTPNPPKDANSSGNDGSSDLRAELAAVIAHPKMPADVRRFAGEDECDRCTRALDAADAVLAAGFRRVSEDDDTTVERVGWAIMHALSRVTGEDYDSTKAAWSEVGRAAVRALREET